MALTAKLDLVLAPSIQAFKVIQDLTYTAVAYGAVGDNISITYLDPGMIDQTISVTVVSNDITVHLATDHTGVLTSTATQIKTAVDASSPAHALVTVAVSGTGSTVETAQAITHLAGGFDTAVSAPQNERVQLMVAITNTQGVPVIIDAIYPRLTAKLPQPAHVVSNPILPQPITIPDATTMYVPFNLILFGKEIGLYTLNVDVCSSASQLLATPVIPASITLI